MEITKNSQSAQILISLITSPKNTPGQYLQLPIQHVTKVVQQAHKTFEQQPLHLPLGPPINICGDIHGQLFDLLRLFQLRGAPPKANYLFLGDYVDRGKNSVATLMLLLSYKVIYPENFFMLRGNHEFPQMNIDYGFYSECHQHYDLKLWKMFTSCFSMMPITALIDKKILCMHGGLSPQLQSLKQLKGLKREYNLPEQGLLVDLLWSDPEKNITEWLPNTRGISHIFGEKHLQSFLKKNDVDLVCRAHQCVLKGYEFFGDNALVTIFSAPNYCGYGNDGAVMWVNEDLECGFKVLKAQKM